MRLVEVVRLRVRKTLPELGDSTKRLSPRRERPPGFEKLARRICASDRVEPFVNTPLMEPSAPMSMVSSCPTGLPSWLKMAAEVAAAFCEIPVKSKAIVKASTPPFSGLLPSGSNSTIGSTVRSAPVSSTP